MLKTPAQLEAASGNPFSAWEFLQRHRRLLLRAALIILAGGLVFAPTLQGDWLWDDDVVFLYNNIAHDPAGLWIIWFRPGNLTDYYPLLASAEWLEWHLFHRHPAGYHVITLSLHIVNALLVWRLLGKFNLRLAWLGGLIFAIHPLMVESVAWMAELKNTLSLFPFLLAMCRWIDYEERGQARDYRLTLGLFLLAMLGKTTMAAFPAVILLYAWWKRGRVTRADLYASLPFFGLALALGLVTVKFLSHYSIREDVLPAGGVFSKLALAGLTVDFYLYRFFWPVGLLPSYPPWKVNPPSAVQFLIWPVLAGAGGWLWTKRAGWGRHVLLGFGFFLINLTPVMAFIMGKYASMAWSLDHLGYLPVIGLIGTTVMALEQLEGRLPASLRRWTATIVLVLMALLAWMSHGYARKFINMETLMTYTLRSNPEDWRVRQNLGVFLFKSGRVAEGMEQFKETIKLYPGYAQGHVALGLALMQTGRSSDAMEQFKTALKINPDDVLARANLAKLQGLPQTAPAGK